MIADCAIIGAGPAGVAAAIQLTRAGCEISLFERRNVCGALRNAHLIENYLGFPRGVRGSDLAELLSRQLASHGVEPIPEEVIAITENAGSAIIRTPSGHFRARRVIVATGTTPRRYGIAGMEDLTERTVFHELRDMPALAPATSVLILGGGDVAFDYAIHLHEIGCVSTLLMRGPARCLPLLRRRAEERKIRCIEHDATFRMIRRSGDRVEVDACGDIVSAQYVLVAVGREPSRPLISTRTRGLVLYAGDVHNGSRRHVQIAAGDGLRAALIALDADFHQNTACALSDNTATTR